MQRWFSPFSLILTAILVGACGSQPQTPVDDAFTQFRHDIGNLEQAADKTALCEDFLERYPDSEYTADLAGAVAYYRGEAMEDPQGAVSFFDQLLPKINDPETRFAVEFARFPLALETGGEANLEAIADRLREHRSLTFSENLDLARLAAEFDLWDLAERSSRDAAALASPEAFRAEHPDTDLDDDEIALKARDRTVMAAAERGRALAHLDRGAEALEVFEKAAPLSRSNYLGVPKSPLFTYWGRTELDSGDAERALELLGPNAVLGDDDLALDAFREAYLAVNGDDGGFDEFLWNTRKRLARVVDDFELPDYEGTPHRISDLRGKVVFLSFWFPT